MDSDDDILKIIEVGLTLRFRKSLPSSEAAIATQCTVDYLADFSDLYGGTRPTIRRRHRTKYSLDQIRHIKKQFTGKNADEIQRQYGISRATLYRYLAK